MGDASRLIVSAVLSAPTPSAPSGSDDVTTWFAIVISVAALGVAIWARVEGHLERRERRRESAELRKRLARSEFARLGARQQDATMSSFGDTYVFTITNAGPAVARNVFARVVDWDDETRLGDEIASEHVKTAIPVGGEVTLEFEIPEQFRTAALRLHADWADDREYHRDEWLLNLRPPRETYRQ